MALVISKALYLKALDSRSLKIGWGFFRRRDFIFYQSERTFVIICFEKEVVSMESLYASNYPKA